MAIVKGSQQDELVIYQYRPGQRLRRNVYLVLFILAVGIGGYYMGLFDSMEQIETLTQTSSRLQAQLDDTELEKAALAQRVGVLEKGGEVDRKATDSIRQTVKELKAQITTLEEEVAFYKGIMAPSSNDKGLRVSKIDLTPSADSQMQFRYSIMLTQVADNSSYISGLAAVNFVGVRNGERIILPLRDLDSSVTELGVKFRFRYFQEVAGEITIPANFTPEQVQVVLQSTGSKAQRVEQTIEWPQ